MAIRTATITTTIIMTDVAGMTITGTGMGMGTITIIIPTRTDTIIMTGIAAVLSITRLKGTAQRK